ncbi:MAG TPA: aminoglycoside phosphotransferase family protein [Thermomicrobiales bacterium]|jgi:aminoglycoside phosphotransferase (APT) family kinase protein|nr:aminoglycoside phosphotransferase family protein [Thermomicrobiales bacterium]
MDPSSTNTLDTLETLVRDAGLPGVMDTYPLRGRGVANQIVAARLADGSRVVLRIRPPDRAPERARARLLEAYRLPKPRLLSEAGNAALYEFAPGQPLGDTVELGTADSEDWAKAGRAYRKVHDVTFPHRLAGDVSAAGIYLRSADPVAEQHAALRAATERLTELLPVAARSIPALHRQIDAAATWLCSAPTSLLHGDVDLWNAVIDPSGATLVDWDEPMVGDPARELALLDMHASLINGRGLPRAFYNGYGRGPIEPNTSLYRITGTIAWLTSDDWERFESLDADLRAKTRSWFMTLRDWTSRLPEHIDRLKTLSPRPVVTGISG